VGPVHVYLHSGSLVGDNSVNGGARGTLLALMPDETAETCGMSVHMTIAC